MQKPHSISKAEKEFISILPKRKKLPQKDISLLIKALDELNLRNTLATVLVAGTNGKGSTAGYLWQLSSLAGLKTGLFTSPHLFSICERFQCTDENIDILLIKNEYLKLKTLLSSEIWQDLSYFEVLTLIALSLFQKLSCTLVILEIGLGGRLDACNAVEPITSVITNIDYDHQKYLGDSLEEIAREKLGITRSHTPLFWGQSTQEDQATKTMQEYRKEEKNLTFTRNKHFSLSNNEKYVWLKISEQSKVETFLLPSFLSKKPFFHKENFSLALATMNWLKEHQKQMNIPKLNLDIFYSLKANILSFSPYSHIGRMQEIFIKNRVKQTTPKTLILDVGHNPAALKKLKISLRKQLKNSLNKTNRIPAVLSLLADKDLSSMLHILEQEFRPFILFRSTSERSINKEKLKEIRPDLSLYEDFDAAWSSAQKKWKQDKTWLVGGSFAATADAMSYLKKNGLQITEKY